MQLACTRTHDGALNNPLSGAVRKSKMHIAYHNRIAADGRKRRVSLVYRCEFEWPDGRREVVFQTVLNTARPRIVLVTNDEDLACRKAILPADAWQKEQRNGA